MAIENKKFNEVDWNSKDYVLNEMSSRGTSYMSSNIGDVLKNDKDFMIEQIKMNAHNLNRASNELKNDPEVVIEAVNKKSIDCFSYASNRLKNNEEFVLKVVKIDGWALRNASEKLQHNENIVIEAVKENYRVLQQVKPEFKDNEKVVLEAVKQDDWAIRWASERIQNAVGISNPEEFLKIEVAKEKPIHMANDFRTIIDSKQIQELHALILEKNKTVEIPDAYISATNKPKEEIIVSQSESANQNVVEQVQQPQQPIKQRGMKL